MTRVFVAAPTGSLRLGLRALLEAPGIEVVGDGPAPDGAPPDTDVVVLGDEDLLPTAGDAGAEPGPRAVVALADDDRPARRLGRLGLRGWGIVPHDATAFELRAAVTAAAQGLVVLPAGLAARLLPGRGGDPDGEPEPLTAREQTVLELLAQGLSNRRIAERLGISEHTAKFHVASVCGKLGAASRTEAVSRGLRRGLITL
jgi:DNA-binding NarL/FixJ family response regulator